MLSSKLETDRENTHPGGALRRAVRFDGFDIMSTFAGGT